MTIFAKGIPAKNVVVDFGEQIVCFIPFFDPVEISLFKIIG